MIRMLVISAVQVKIGMRIRVMPGVRIRMIVTKKLMPVSNVPKPDTCNAQM